MEAKCLILGLGRRQTSYIFVPYPASVFRHQIKSSRYASSKPEPRHDEHHEKLKQPDPSPQDRLDLIQSPPSHINPPVSTIPAPVNPPERQPDQNRIAWLFKVGKAYVTFYKTGVKNIWANRKIANTLRQRLNEAKLQKQLNSTAPSEQTAWAQYKSSILSRAEHQLLLRSNYDMRRVPIFALVLLVFGEWTPLIVIFLTPIVPYTCRIPTQIEKARRAIEERRKQSFRGETNDKLSDEARKKMEETVFEIDGVGVSLDRALHISRSLGLHASIWDKVSYVPRALLERKIKMRLQSVIEDDMLLLRDAHAHGSSSASDSSGPRSDAATIVKRDLSLEELQMACEERGIDILERPEAELRRDLGRWLTVAVKTSTQGQSTMISKTLDLLYNRPNAWRV